MNFDLAVNRHRDELLRIVVSLFTMLGLMQGVALGRISHALHRKALRIFRPAESAVRRLIVVAARGMVAEPAAPRPRSKGTAKPNGTGKRSTRTPAFNISDKHEPWLPPKSKRKKYQKPPPRIWVVDHDPRWPALLASQQAAFRAGHGIQLQEPEPKPKPESDGKVDASRLMRRLPAIKAALEDIARQARRLARWKATRERQADAGKLVHTTPLREGRPPGFREINSDEVDRLLDECTWLAMQATREPRPIDRS